MDSKLEPIPSGEEPDAYDKAVEYLTANPDNIRRCWIAGGLPPENRPGKDLEPCCLFQFMSPHDGKLSSKDDKLGCPTQIKSKYGVSVDKRLTKMIRKDEGIPSCGMSIRPRHLKRFAEYQRLADQVFKRKPPEWTLS